MIAQRSAGSARRKRRKSLQDYLRSSIKGGRSKVLEKIASRALKRVLFPLRKLDFLIR
jgi:hypothetical protein